MKITSIIPCYYKHFYLVNDVLNCYLNNTILPDQIIISLNGCKFIDNNLIIEFENKYKKLFDDFLVIKTDDLLSRPKARNVCIKHIKHEIVCFSDSDDYEHLQRFEIIKYFFENKHIDHLLHSYILSKCFSKKCGYCFLCKNNYNNKFIKYKLEDIDYCDKEIINKINFPDESIKPNVKSILALNRQNKQIIPVHGLVCVKKHVLDKIKFNENYPRGQDSLFSQEVLNTYKNTIVIDAQLHIYNNGWVPSKEHFKEIEYKNNYIYMNFGSDNPPSPGTPRTNKENNIIIKTIKEIIN